MSKKIKVLIILMIIIIIIGFVWGIGTFIRFFKFKNIYNKLDENLEYDNYYLKTITISKNKERTITEAFYKNGTGKLVAENGIYTWVNNKTAYMIDEENKKAYILNVDEFKSLVSYEMFADLIPGYNKSFFERFLMAGNFSNKVKKVKLNDQKCYMIKIKDDVINKSMWIDEKTKKPIKATIEFPNGDVIEYEYELQFNATKLKDIELPDLNEYDFL